MSCRCPYCTAPFEHDVWGPDDEIEKLQEENQHLRAALERIRDCTSPGSLPYTQSRADWMRQVAKEALK